LIERAIVIDPMDPSLRVNLGYLLAALGRVEPAEAIADKLVVDHPQFPGGYGLQAHLRRARGDLVGELRSYDRLLGIDPLSLTAKRARCFTLARAGLFENARTCARKMGKVDDDTVADVDAAIAAWTFDADALGHADARMTRKNPAIRALLARMNGKPELGVDLLREEWPEWFKNPIGKPNLDNEYQFIEAAEALLAAGDEAQARRVLVFGLDMLSRRQPGPGAAGGRDWPEAIALALLGRHDEACAAMTAATAAGLYEGRGVLLTEPLLAEFREQACFAPAFARVDALAKAQVAAATKAGLL
jgi:tetratricopeptide (TPR) repeat protein